MKRKLDLNIVEKWVSSVGGPDKAASLVQEKLECSMSKALKFVRCQYDSTPMPTEQMALADLMYVARNDLFPLVEQRKGRTRNAS